ncbi:MAG: hypothetical protein HYZ94_01960 [Candidatus Omnitrophica bacterium]|nr:hypothetical protein [Candidatus Omnitrophota bacterium]
MLGLFFSLFLSLPFSSSPASATTQQEVYVTGHVQSFGGYTFSEGFSFEIQEPGEQEIGAIVVDGLYNGEYPWILRVYTDNLRFAGIAGAASPAPSAGLVSKDGAYSLPLFIHTPNLGEAGWRRVPDLNEKNYVPYQPDPDPGVEAAYTDCVVMGVDPRNGAWAAGPDGLVQTLDDNPLGDITMETPFEMVVRADVPPTAPRVEYETTLYLEIIPAP